MDRAKIDRIRAKLGTMFGDLEREFGLKVKVGSGSFTQDNLSLRLEFAEISSSGQVMDRDAIQFTRCSQLYYGIPARILGKEFTRDGSKYRVVGMTSRRSRSPIIVLDLGSNKRYRMPAITILTAFNIPAANSRRMDLEFDERA